MEGTRKFSVYDAKTKRGKTMMVNKADFNDEDELEAYIQQVRAKQRVLNKDYKKQAIREHIEEQIAKPLEPANISIDISSKTLDNLNNFYLDKNTGNSCVIFGSSKSGKTTLMIKTIYEQYYKNDKSFICSLFSGNYQIDAYKNNKNLLIGDGFNQRTEKYVRMHKFINSRTDNHYNFLEMFDDILEMRYNKLINNLLLSYRNSNISSIICLQYIKLINKQNRGNINNIIIFRSHSEESIKDIIDTFLKQYLIKMGLKTYPQQHAFYLEVTDNYGFFYICTRLNRLTMHRIKY